jgi:ankyrin repeat protein
MMKCTREFVRSVALAFLATAMAVGIGDAAPAPVKGKLGAALMGAASRGDTAAVKGLLARGADPNARNFLKITPLMTGAMLGDLPMVQALLAAGAELEATSLYGTALTFAAQTGNETVIQALLRRGANVNASRPDGITVLMLAARADRPSVVRELLARRAPVNARDNHGATALIHAARAGSLAAARVLLQHGAALEPADREGWTPLMHAAVNRHSDLVALLLEKGAPVNARDEAGRTALLITASYGDHPASIRALLDGGAAIEARDAKGRTALALTEARGYGASARALRDRGAAPVAADVAASTNTPRNAAAASLPLLQHSMQVFASRTGCVSCHQEGLGRVVTGLARERGFPIDAEFAQTQNKRVLQFLADRRPVISKAAEDPTVLKNLSEDAIGELTPITGYLLNGLAAHDQPADEMLAAESVVLARQQTPDGDWTFAVPRVPMQSSRFTMTALALRAMRVYAPKDRAQESARRIIRAKRWLLTAPAQTTEDKAMRLLGLKWAGVVTPAEAGAGYPQRRRELGAEARRREWVPRREQGVEERQEAIQALRAAQRPDGGWAQLDSLQSDAYATGQVLFALNQAGEIPVTDPAYRRGVAFLLRTQDDDGSWFVNKRALPLNDYFDAGFPHGQSQFSSFNATCWATMALLLAVEPAKAEDVAAR